MKEESKKQSSRSARSSAILQSLVSLLLVAFILGMVNYLGFKYYKKIDLTQNQLYTLSSKSQEVAKSFPGPVSVWVFPIFGVGSDNNPYEDTGKEEQIYELLKEYAGAAPEGKFTIERIDPRVDTAKSDALIKEYHLTKPINCLIIKLGDQTKVVQTADLYDATNPYIRVPPFKGESILTADFITLMDPKIPKVYFIKDHGEHSIADSGPGGSTQLRDLLHQENIDSIEMSIASQGDVPADAAAVVILGPTTPFQPFEVEAISRYLSKNGHLVVIQDLTVKSGLEELLASYSLRFDEDTIITRVLQLNQTLLGALILPDGFSGHPITAKFQGQNILLQLAGFRSISYGFTNNKDQDSKTTYLMRTSDAIPNWGMTKPLTVSMTTDDLGNLQLDPKTDIKPPLAVAALYDSNFAPGAQKPDDSDTPSTKIVVFGGSSFLLNQEVTRNPYPINIFVNCLDWMTKKNPVLAIAPKPPQEYLLSLSPMQLSTVTWFVIVFIPGFFLGLAVLTWFSRRK